MTWQKALQERGMALFLTIETTCDETAAAIVSDQLEVLSSVVASQDRLHQQYGGVVPELASRAHMERILPVIHEAVTRAGVRLDEIDAIAVAYTPGLAGSLLIGLTAAKSLCVALDRPLIAINHLQAHIYACRMAAGENVFPCVGLVISGGHTCLYRCLDPLDFDLLGCTLDDAAGEAFDKVAAMLRLPYPGGPSVEKAAASGDPKKYGFPRAFLDDPDCLDFSFSGLKTAVRYAITGPGRHDVAKVELAPQVISDIAASFQEAVVDCIVAKSFQALEKTNLQTLCVGGGVAANRRLRQRLEEEAKNGGIRLIVAPLRLCTDNAVMGAIAVERWRAKLFAPLDLDVEPGVVRRGAKVPK